MKLKPILENVVKRYGLPYLLLGSLFLFGCSDWGDSSNNGGGGSGPGDGVSDPVQEEVYIVTSPVRISEFDAQTLLVSDAGTKKVLFVDKLTLEARGGFKIAGKPSGVLFVDNRFFVGNNSNGSVEIFNAEGRILGRLGKRGQFGLVNDLATNRDLGLIYVLDAKARLISIFNFDGTGAGTIGPGPMLRPTALTIDSSGRLIVSDLGDPANGSFSARPVFLSVFNSAGGYSHNIPVGTNEVTTPQGLFAVAGTVYMADARSGKVNIFNIDTTVPVATLGTLGVDDGELFYPLDVFVDSATSDVFVADFQNQRVAVFLAGGLLP